MQFDRAMTADDGVVAGELTEAGEMVREAYKPHREDDDFGQAGTQVRQVLDDAQRERLVSNISGHLLDGVSRPVLDRALAYWRNVDKGLGDRVAAKVGGG